MWSGIKTFLIVLVVCLLCMAAIRFLPMDQFAPTTVEVTRETFTETAEAVNNPNRGLYSIYGVRITDQKKDYLAAANRMAQKESPINLIMVQINLARYQDTELSDQALRNIADLFSALRTTDKNWILRFTYDWKGKAERSEPENIEIIFRHMMQLQPLLQANGDRIFVIQGLFTGNWGEMNNTRYGSPEDLLCLSETLKYAAGESTFLSVRTGAQWRTLTGIHRFEDVDAGTVPRVGLYNDAMMGSESDWGTYRSPETHGPDPEGRWSRTEELEFQNLLCRYVPNGGEVIASNPLNDFENAVATLRKMRVTYLNYDYDREVLDKWSAVTVEDGAYRGLDGLSYIERHLGYRILIRDVKAVYHPQLDKLTLELELQNVGFAPIYAQQDILLQICDEENNLVYSHRFDEDIRKLYGGENSGDLLELHHQIPIGAWPRGEYRAHLALLDRDTGNMLLLANEQSATQYGYYIAGIKRS